MRREAWGDQATRSSSAKLAGDRSGGGSKLETNEASARIFVYDLDANIPKEDLEQGLLGLFAVFGSVVRVSCLPGRPCISNFCICMSCVRCPSCR